jgi:hypothetical protein
VQNNTCFSYNKLLKSNPSQELGEDLMLTENWEYRYWICNHESNIEQVIVEITFK